jgi:hypothetical protein
MSDRQKRAAVREIVLGMTCADAEKLLDELRVEVAA